MAQAIQVLIVEDNEDDAELLLRELRRGGFEPAFRRVDSLSQTREALKEEWNLVISDWNLPQFSAIEVLGLVKEAELDLPFIIVSGAIGEEAAVSSLRAGAHDFIAKGNLARLIPAIERELHEAASRAENRLIHRQLQRSQKMEAMGQLTGGIAHDFNNLLGVIVATAESLLELVRDKTDETDLTREIIRTALRGADLTHGLLAFARQQPLSAQRIDLNAILSRTITLLQRTLGPTITISTKFADSLWEARADFSQVDNAVLNLAINARDAMPGGGTLSIETANVQLDGHYAELNPGIAPGDYVLISVTDTGIGMPPEVIERAIEPFFTTKEPGKGTGLGLSMVYGFAKQSGGHFSIYSEVGVGTTMRLYLPRATGVETAPSAALPATPDAAVAGKAILLVDDNAPLRRVTGRRLRALGYSVIEAENGNDALAVVDSGEHLELLFTDIGLPGGMNGYQLAERVRQKIPDIKILFTSGYAHAEGQIAGDDMSPQQLLHKPYTGDELSNALRLLFNEK